MKKLGLILMVFILLSAGCNQESDENKVPSGGTTDNSSTAEVQGYVFEADGVSIAMHAEVAPILEVLGEEKSYFEAESCAFQGMEKTYTYNGFEIHTYELEGVDLVASIVFLDDSVTTKEGLFLYCELEDVIEAYGDDYIQDMGLYTYTLDKSKISFLIENNEVVSIEYIAINE
ncbi:MAG: hypothetical protein ACOWWR_17930 [Eubacteriales bacterium]